MNASGLGCVCVPGTIGDCFGGPEAALGNTPCKRGKQLCIPDGAGYGECVGQTLPAPEPCSPSGMDDHCDGRVDEEGPDCVCGDGVVSNAEVCDDRNTDESDTCTTTCVVPGCGDGIVQDGEACDDGNLLDSDACTAQCQMATCGDELLQVGVEACDDGNTIDTDACTSSCQHAICGDGFVRQGSRSATTAAPRRRRRASPIAARRRSSSSRAASPCACSSRMAERSAGARTRMVSSAWGDNWKQAKRDGVQPPVSRARRRSHHPLDGPRQDGRRPSGREAPVIEGDER